MPGGVDEGRAYATTHHYTPRVAHPTSPCSCGLPRPEDDASGARGVPRLHGPDHDGVLGSPGVLGGDPELRTGDTPERHPDLHVLGARVPVERAGVTRGNGSPPADIDTHVPAPNRRTDDLGVVRTDDLGREAQCHNSAGCADGSGTARRVGGRDHQGQTLAVVEVGRHVGALAGTDDTYRIPQPGAGVARRAGEDERPLDGNPDTEGRRHQLGSGDDLRQKRRSVRHHG